MAQVALGILGTPYNIFVQRLCPHSTNLVVHSINSFVGTIPLPNWFMTDSWEDRGRLTMAERCDKTLKGATIDKVITKYFTALHFSHQG